MVRPPELWARYELGHVVERGNTASLEGLDDEAQERVGDVCEEMGLELRRAQDGRGMTARPIVDDDPELLELLELLGEGDGVSGANPYGCNRYGHRCPQKGTTREPQTKGTPRRVHKVDQTQPMHKQVNDLADALERAARDGTRLEAVIYRPEFGELILSCGSSQKNGVTHVMLPRHHISYAQVAETLLKGDVRPHPYKESRLEITWDKYLVVLEREIKQNSNRISKMRAKLHTAYNVLDGKE